MAFTVADKNAILRLLGFSYAYQDWLSTLLDNIDSSLVTVVQSLLSEIFALEIKLADRLAADLFDQLDSQFISSLRGQLRVKIRQLSGLVSVPIQRDVYDIYATTTGITVIPG
jgi:hypothetical protein